MTEGERDTMVRKIRKEAAINKHYDRLGYTYLTLWADQIEADGKRIAELEAALNELETESYRFASFYPKASDGYNTFIIFADKIAEKTTLGKNK